MLKEIRFKNWKSFGEATLYIDPLTVLIGTNASGKSNALDGLELMSYLLKGIPLTAALEGIRGGQEWATLKPGNQFTLEVLVQKSEHIDFRYIVTVRTSPYLEILSEKIEQYRYGKDGTTHTEVLYSVQQLPPIKKSESVYEVKWGSVFDRIHLTHSNLVSSLLLNMSSMSQYAVLDNGAFDCIRSAMEKVFILDPIPSRMKGYTAISKNLERDASNIAGVLASFSLEEKERIEQTLSGYVTQLPEHDIRKIWAESIGRLKKDAMLYSEEVLLPGEPPLIVDPQAMSDGTLRFIGILTALLTRPEGSLIVIDEVDNGLHPSRVSLLFKMFKEICPKRNIDVLVTTHNPALLDALGPEMVPFVVVAHRDPKLGQSKLTLMEDIQNLPKLLASGPIGKVVTQGEIEKSLAQETGDEQ